MTQLSAEPLFAADHDAYIWILERAETKIFLRWLQSGRCHYAEQRWRLATARRRGRCAISDRPIKVGDPVYHPDPRLPAVNANVAILKSALPLPSGSSG
ncbi:DUF3331 domain-containing protein [Paraburkholderia sediminicola]|uniref:DUF3331 domain-containing protein n=1 Tax=Paraburkholderia sediminicola TaxID=458836 RepID=UPI0038BCDD37